MYGEGLTLWLRTWGEHTGYQKKRNPVPYKSYHLLFIQQQLYCEMHVQWVAQDTVPLALWTNQCTTLEYRYTADISPQRQSKGVGAAPKKLTGVGTIYCRYRLTFIGS